MSGRPVVAVQVGRQLQDSITQLEQQEHCNPVIKQLKATAELVANNLDNEIWTVVKQLQQLERLTVYLTGKMDQHVLNTTTVPVSGRGTTPDIKEKADTVPILHGPLSSMVNVCESERTQSKTKISQLTALLELPVPQCLRAELDKHKWKQASKEEFWKQLGRALQQAASVERSRQEEERKRKEAIERKKLVEGIRLKVQDLNTEASDIEKRLVEGATEVSDIIQKRTVEVTTELSTLCGLLPTMMAVCASERTTSKMKIAQLTALLGQGVPHDVGVELAKHKWEEASKEFDWPRLGCALQRLQLSELEKNQRSNIENEEQPERVRIEHEHTRNRMSLELTPKEKAKRNEIEHEEAVERAAVVLFELTSQEETMRTEIEHKEANQRAVVEMSCGTSVVTVEQPVRHDSSADTSFESSTVMLFPTQAQPPLRSGRRITIGVRSPHDPEDAIQLPLKNTGETNKTSTQTTTPSGELRSVCRVVAATMTDPSPPPKPTVNCALLNKVLSSFYNLESGELLVPLMEAMRTLRHYFKWVVRDIPLQEHEERDWRNAMAQLHDPVYVEQQFIWCTKLQPHPTKHPTFLLRNVKALVCGDICVVLPGAVWRVDATNPYMYILEWCKNLVLPVHDDTDDSNK
eukprot:TRINITY_DN64964_c0_g1_i2.p2 TRINITY_DN64964_c0_g1~~TRINITY_DN64964_c0_g1_i2.p2  ORF type:complete len:634 (+),score=38.35 TRINITY_DN64964_c0_g1_i2:457-2358(+)